MAKPKELTKHLGLVELVFFGIGAIVGTGIFVIPAIVASLAGVASLIVWLELGLLTIFMALCFAELSSIHPHAGGPYIFVKEAFGEFAGFLSGWSAWLVSWVTIASLAVATSFYIGYFVPLTHLMEVMIAIVLLVGITAINIFGMKWGLKAQYVLTTISILVLWMFVTWGIYWIDLSNYQPTQIVTLPILLAAAVWVIEPFMGWETITYFSEDAINPKRDVPKAIIYSSIFVTVIYCAVIFVTMGLLDQASLGASKYPLALASEVFLTKKGAVVMAVGAIAVLLGCLNSWIASTARLPFALARDGLFPNFLSAVHKKHGTPWKSLIFQMVFAIAVVLLGGFEEIITILVVVAMFLYIPVFLSIFVYRKKIKDIPYKVPLVKVVVGVAVGLAVFLLINTDPWFLLAGGGLVLCGTPVYWYMTRKRKK
ncbi:APC family permease [Candidatus Undinarchaeota archaeon]